MKYYPAPEAGITNFEVKTYPTESTEDRTWKWGKTWSGAQINSTNFAIAIVPAYRYKGGSYHYSTASAIVAWANVKVYAYSSSIAYTPLVPGHAEISGTIKNTWLTQSQYVTFWWTRKYMGTNMDAR